MSRKKSQLLVNRYPEGISPGGKIVCLPCIPAGVDELEFYKDEYFKLLDERETFMMNEQSKIDSLLEHVSTIENRLDTGIKRYKKLVKKHNSLVEKYNNEHNEYLKLKDKCERLKYEKLCDSSDEYKKLFNQYNNLKRANIKLQKKIQYLLDNAVFTKHSATIHPQ